MPSFERKTGNPLQTPTYNKWWLKLFNVLRHCGELTYLMVILLIRKS